MGDLGRHQAFFGALSTALLKSSNLNQFDHEFDIALSREAPPSGAIPPPTRGHSSTQDDIETTIPNPQPDEIIHGWRGRVAALNSLSKISQVEPLLRAYAEKSQTALSDDADFIECAAVALNITRQELIRQHTLLPFYDALGELKQNKPGTKSAKHLRTYLRQAPFRIEGQEPRFCRHCVDEDLTSRKFSYWRCSHHLPGVQCCSTHGTPLLSAGKLDAFDFCPQHFLASPLRECTSTHGNSANQILLRYSQIAADILSSAPIIESEEASIKLGQLASAAGLRFSNSGRRKTVSTYAMEILPTEWLLSTFPRVHWRADKFISTFDGACSPRSTRYTTATLCLLAAILYDSADQALADLLKQTPYVGQKEALGFNFWASKEVLDIYVECNGVVSLVAERLGLPSSSVSIGLQNQGLPGLGKSAGLRKALKALHAGEDLSIVCSKENVSAEQLIKLLLASGKRLAMALEMMSDDEIKQISHS